MRTHQLTEVNWLIEVPARTTQGSHVLMYCEVLFSDYRMHILCALLLLDRLVLARSSPALNKMWDEWKIKHRKVYDNQVGLREPPLVSVAGREVLGFTQWFDHLCFRLRSSSGELCGRRTRSWCGDTTRRPRQENTASQWGSITWLTW